ncbi:MAG: NAD(P)/FAD-dependent oxidoreductase [Candidatus Berkiella sp.]
MMKKTIKVDLAIIGGGAGGLSIAAGAAQMGASVALIEKGKMGGDCLNSGCVPSKSLLAAAKVAHTMRKAHQFGIQAVEPEVDFTKVMEHVHGVIDTIAVHDSVDRFEKLGVAVIQAPGRFQDKCSVVGDDTLVKAKRFVIATGSSPAIPPVPGLDKVSYFTNESIFFLTEKPSHLIVIGGGPIGSELAQAFLLLGVKVTVLEAFKMLPRDEQDLVAILRDQLLQQGLNLYENTKILDVKQSGQNISVLIENGHQQETITGSHLLVAAGRRPNVADLNLEAANIKYSPKGIQVDSRLRTSNSHVYAIGDAIGSYQFTHIANYHAGIVLRNVLFRMPVKVDYRAVPWVTYTLPELAHVGLSSEEALKQDPNTKITVWDFKENDRAQAEHETTGKIKIITNQRGKVLGATILGPHAGELLTPWIDAVQHQKSVRSMTNNIIPYPTLSEISKRVAGEYYTPMLYSHRTKLLVSMLKYFW